MLPYELGTEAVFTPGQFNGRPLHMDAYDVILTLATNRPIETGRFQTKRKSVRSFPIMGRRIPKWNKPDLSQYPEALQELRWPLPIPDAYPSHERKQHE